MSWFDIYYRLRFIASPHREFAQRIYKRLHYQARNIDLFKVAFTHSSAQTVLKNGEKVNNERLEFLGDAVLDAVIADFLFRKYPSRNEGFLTQLRSRIVKRDYLNVLARRIGIDQLLISNTSKSPGKKNIYGDAFEAFIGAIYLDRGYRCTTRYITNFIIPRFINLENLESYDNNFKSQLLEWSQKQKQELDYYTDNDPMNAGRFISYIRINHEIIGIGIGSSKKEAEQDASEKALFRITSE
ncbi:MAG: ribonuclease III [Bacteroidales bacterium]|nr:ribonuclease III [Bacteroidales bacterium]